MFFFKIEIERSWKRLVFAVTRRGYRRKPKQKAKNSVRGMGLERSMEDWVYNASNEWLTWGIT